MLTDVVVERRLRCLSLIQALARYNIDHVPVIDALLGLIAMGLLNNYSGVPYSFMRCHECEHTGECDV